MKLLIPEQLISLANRCPAPLYLVGGSVRDFLAGFPIGAKTDWDLASPLSEDDLIAAATACRFTVRAVYPRTGTVKLQDEEGVGYEFTRFRSDSYVRGEHTPRAISFTKDVATDALRRDFRANAVYYDIAADAFVDPLGGIEDIREKRLAAVREAEKVFGEDGLRLMRLARIAAETGFSPDEEALRGARANAALIRDIAPERVFAELMLILRADTKHGGKEAPYRGLSILRAAGVLPYILPELAAGDGMAQRSDYHAHDVLEHSLLCVRHAPLEIRLAALLHDVGKPFCMARDGNFYAHPEEGARIAEEILSRLKAPKKLTAETAFLVRMHMRDFDCKMRPFKVRREIVSAGGELPRLLALKQADFTACRGDLSPAPTVVKWEKILSEMKEEGVPFTLAELSVSGLDLQREGVPAARTAEALRDLLDWCAEDGSRNGRAALLARASRFARP